MYRSICVAGIFSLIFFSHAVKAEKIIIDADVGIDDAMAILLAYASPELELIGITTTFGNATLENSTKNALHLVEITGHETPVIMGSAQALIKPPEAPADFVHGANGLGNHAYPDPVISPLQDLSAAEFIIEQSRRYPGELTLVPVGRLTNLALALRLDPELPKRIKRVVLMGGAFKTMGNVSPVAEANINGDAEAADMVFSAGWDLVAVGLDVTLQILVGEQHLIELAEENPTTGKFIQNISAFYLEFYRSIGLTQGFSLHDPSAVLFLTHPELFEIEMAPVRVVTQGIAYGQTIAAFPPMDQREGSWQAVKPSAIALDVDSEAARTLFLQRLSSLDLVRNDN